MTSTPISAKRKREEDQPSSPATKPHNGPEPADAPRVIGPAVPHHLGSSTPSDIEEKKPSKEEESDDSDDDSDDDFGPQLPPAAGTQAAKRNEDASWAETINNKATEKASSKPVERDEWMVVPPTKGSWASGTQGAPMQSRKFTTGRSARSSAATEGSAASTWTEDASQKRLRLENEVLGIQVQNKTTEKKSQPARHNDITAKRLNDTRGQEKKPSLFETHKQRSQKADEDDPSARPFDREKDIAGPTNISNASRKEMLNRASDYSSRFSGGKYL
ncbi:uncharacterized protein TRUGW13939_01057 [Talaromyces rugulosus]|uniref:DUF3752 domain-containing protein n=1 Tax=Talaromyces rugulosus TaxID=121627 RepID=A0A7H8QJ58_TALRU|nr:uncharacterized protein TRUGW13939_01057 [Talaromyces rugulosus]QKX53977.1 hypothetical protein TRUGW13939_01057 [Talaromyces rugulosus]